jgi:hypothetical protein
MNNNNLSNQIKIIQQSNNIKNKENNKHIEKLNQLSKSINNDYKGLEKLYDMLKNELHQIKIENDESYKQISIMQTKLDNISITNDSINNELKIVKSALENSNRLNNKLRIENDELISLKNFLLIEYEKLINLIN